MTPGAASSLPARSRPKSPRQVLQLAKEYGVHAQVYINGELAYEHHNEMAEMYERSFGFPGIEIPDIFEREDIVTPKVLYVARAENHPRRGSASPKRGSRSSRSSGPSRSIWNSYSRTSARAMQ